MITEEDAKLAADTTIEYLVDKGYISQDRYGTMPSTIFEDIAELIVEALNQ